METYTEEIKEVTVLSGTTGNVVDEATDVDGSVIVGAIIYADPLTVNPSLVNASLFADGREISKMQHIDNYRSREAAYHLGFKPITPVESGKRIRFEVRAASNFTADFKAQLILIKQIRKTC